eukprot:4351598-Prymnesium_polylepis.1
MVRMQCVECVLTLVHGHVRGACVLVRTRDAGREPSRGERGSVDRAHGFFGGRGSKKTGKKSGKMADNFGDDMDGDDVFAHINDLLAATGQGLRDDDFVEGSPEPLMHTCVAVPTSQIKNTLPAA